MIKYNDKIKRGKLGVNYVTDIVDRCNCYFNKIEQENDIGIDGIIEFTDDSIPTGKCIAVQIKTGESYVKNKLPEISYEESNNLLESANVDEVYIAINSLAKRYANKIETWDKLIEVFRKTSDIDLINEIIFYLSYIPGHGDLWAGVNFSEMSKKHARDILNKLSTNEVIKILSAVDENGIDRGTIGQCVEAIISSINNSDKILKEIIKNENLEEEIINNAISILAYSYPEEFNLAISTGEIKSNWYIELIVDSFKTYGGFDLY